MTSVYVLNLRLRWIIPNSSSPTSAMRSSRISFNSAGVRAFSSGRGSLARVAPAVGAAPVGRLGLRVGIGIKVASGSTRVRGPTADCPEPLPGLVLKSLPLSPRPRPRPPLPSPLPSPLLLPLPLPLTPPLSVLLAGTEVLDTVLDCKLWLADVVEASAGASLAGWGQASVTVAALVTGVATSDSAGKVGGPRSETVPQTPDCSPRGPDLVSIANVGCPFL